MTRQQGDRGVQKTRFSGILLCIVFGALYRFCRSLQQKPAAMSRMKTGLKSRSFSHLANIFNNLEKIWWGRRGSNPIPLALAPRLTHLGAYSVHLAAQAPGAPKIVERRQNSQQGRDASDKDELSGHTHAPDANRMLGR